MAKGKAIAGMQAFKGSFKVLVKLSSDKSIGFTDMRTKLGKIEAQYEKLNAERAEVKSRFPTTVDTTLVPKFAELVGEGLRQCQEVGLTYLQADVNVKNVMGPRDTASMTKKETVMLPKFSGYEKTAYLKYLVWQKQWRSHITDYEEKYWSTMLLNHLDKLASEKIVGLENNYDKVMNAQDHF